MISSLFKFAVATFFLAISPGPDNIYVLIQSVSRGARYGIATALGLITGCVVHTCVVAFGVGVLLKENVWLFHTIEFLGACYLFYLAFKVFTSDASIECGESQIKQYSTIKLYRIGIIMNLLNPKVTLFFLALLPGFVVANGPDAVYQMLLLGGVFMLVSLVVFCGIALAGGRLSDFLQRSDWFPVAAKWLQVIVFIAIGLFILIPVLGEIL